LFAAFNHPIRFARTTGGVFAWCNLSAKQPIHLLNDLSFAVIGDVQYLAHICTEEVLFSREQPDFKNGDAGVLSRNFVLKQTCHRERTAVAAATGMEGPAFRKPAIRASAPNQCEELQTRDTRAVSLKLIA
jgi:hypothetical protein